MPLELFSYQGLMLSKAEIRLLQYSESLDEKRKKYEDEKRHEKLLLEQSLQTSALSGIQLQMDTKHELKELKDSLSSVEINDLKSISGDMNLKDINPDDITKLQDSISSLQKQSDAAIESEEKQTKQSQSKSVKISKLSKDSTAISKDQRQLLNDDDAMNIDNDNNTNIAVSDDITKLENISSSQMTETITKTSIEKGRIRKKQKVEVIDDENKDTKDGNYNTGRLDDLFNVEGLLSFYDWSPITSDLEPISFKLLNLDLSTGNQTLALKITIDPSKGRWSVNICPEDNKDFTDILLHFNPRYGAKEGLVLNNKQGTWGRPMKRSLTQSIRTSSVVLIIQVRQDGFYSYANGTFVAYFPHRTDISSMKSLALQIPATDSMGTPENITIHKIWWGRLEEAVLQTPKTNIKDDIVYDNLWLRSVCIDGLPQEKDPHEIYELEKALYALFQDYVPEEVFIVGEKGRAFLRLASSDSVLPSIQELNNSILADTFCLVMSPAYSLFDH